MNTSPSTRRTDSIERDCLVEKIDHLMLQTPDPDGLFELFSTTLGLPVTAEVATRSGYRSGGVTMGNLSIEFIRFDGASGPPDGTSRFIGLALQPTIPALDAHRTLTERGIQHGPPIVYRGAVPQEYRPYLEDADTTTAKINTNIEMGGLIGEREILMAGVAGVAGGRLHDVVGRLVGRALGRPRLARRLTAGFSLDVPLVQLVEYHHDLDRRRRDDAARLHDADGGTLGVTAVREVVATVPDPHITLREWETLLGRRLDEAKLIDIGAGPSLVFEQGVDPRIDRCVVGVASLDRCRRALEDHDLCGPDIDDETIALRPEAVGGATVWFRDD
jgi:hypothetical protein